MDELCTKKVFPSQSEQNLPHFARKWAKKALVEKFGMLVAFFSSLAAKKNTKNAKNANFGNLKNAKNTKNATSVSPPPASE